MPYENHYSIHILDPEWGLITIKISLLLHYRLEPLGTVKCDRVTRRLTAIRMKGKKIEISSTCRARESGENWLKG
jgi:hypothetical protein